MVKTNKIFIDEIYNINTKQRNMSYNTEKVHINSIIFNFNEISNNQPKQNVEKIFYELKANFKYKGDFQVFREEEQWKIVFSDECSMKICRDKIQESINFNKLKEVCRNEKVKTDKPSVSLSFLRSLKLNRNISFSNQGSMDNSQILENEPLNDLKLNGNISHTNEEHMNKSKILESERSKDLKFYENLNFLTDESMYNNKILENNLLRDSSSNINMSIKKENGFMNSKVLQNESSIKESSSIIQPRQLVENIIDEPKIIYKSDDFLEEVGDKINNKRIKTVVDYNPILVNEEAFKVVRRRKIIKNEEKDSNVKQITKKFVLFKQNINLYLAPSQIHGQGLFSGSKIFKNSKIIEYIGEIIGIKLADKREKYYKKLGISSVYLFSVSYDRIIDATRKGNNARFINHCCSPNSATIIGGPELNKIYIYAIKDIEIGEEITLDYYFNGGETEEDKIKCNCMHANCKIYMG